MTGINSLKNKFVYVLIGLFLCSFSIHAVNDGNRYAKNSVLAKGNWYKIKIPTTGVYKLTYDDLKKMGLSNPKNVQIYGYGGEMLNEDFRTPYIDDLPQVSVWMSKDRENFGSGDYLLFYGKGDIKWRYNESGSEFIHTQHPYSSDSYYFVTEAEAGPQLVISQTATPTGNNAVTTFNDYYLHEKELINLGETGREFFGENFKGTPSQTFSVSLPGVTQDPAKISYHFVARATAGAPKITVSLNEKQIDSKTITKVASGDAYAIANDTNNASALSKFSSENKLNFTYTQSATSDKFIHLNYFRITYTRALKPYGPVTLFRHTDRQPNVEFKIADVSQNILVLDVTDGVKPVKIIGQLSTNTYSFNAPNTQIREYALIDLAKSIPTPSIEGKVINQNLHALKTPEMVIIVQPYLRKYAEELAQVHKDDSGLTTLVISPEDIYNEFSSGKADATAYRRFMKMFYDRATTEAEKPRYLLLFGDGTFDNKFITSEWKNFEKRGILLTYQSPASLSQIHSFATDDYFGFLDDNEISNGLSNAKLALGIGRFPVRTTQEASSVLEKVKRYIRNEEPGIWQNTLCFIADDAIASSYSTTSERVHMEHTDGYTQSIKRSNPEFIINKVYEDSYERVITTNGARYPDAKKAMLDNINAGALIVNYVGHGSVNDWTHEYILTHPDVTAMNNTKLPLWITATCDFSRFDANSTSSGETAILNPRGGAIGLLTTTRVVFISNNQTLLTSLFSHIFEKDDNMPLRFGDIIKRTKLGVSDDNKLRFILLGDPALRLSYPSKKYNVEVEKINDIAITDEKVQIRALDDITIKGRIVDEEGNLVTDFAGNLESMIFDSEQDLKTRGHVNEYDKLKPSSESIALNYKDYTNTIFSGKTRIKDGEFEITFVTPKDILYTNGDGKMNFYAYDDDGDKKAQSSFTNYTVGGTSPGVIPEFNSPVIKEAYLNNNKFKPGDKTNSTPLFYAFVSDDTGINLASGIGHNISLTIDEKTSYDLTSTFVNSGNSSKEGSVRFKIPELTEGNHSLQFKVWDVWNNSQSYSTNFVVANNYKPSIHNLTLKGNPAKNDVTFEFSCDTPESIVNLKYTVYSFNGALKWMHEEKGVAINSDGSYNYLWNLEASNGMKLPPGMYICRVFISINGEESSKSEKLIIIGQ